jgi:hypothetical protein
MLILLSGTFISRRGLFSALSKQIFVTTQICCFTVAAEHDRMKEVSRGWELLEINY